MRLQEHTVLVTGGATGIGFGIARMFVEAGSGVIISGRRQEALDQARKKLPKLAAFSCDLSRAEERERLAKWIAEVHPSLDVLVNNAGIQQRMDIHDADFWKRSRDELAINLEAPVHLTHLLLSVLSRNKGSHVINVSSGLAFVPMSRAPVYCATKAAIHSFTQSLRRQLKQDGIEVIEIIPPAVATDLGGAGLHAAATPVAEFMAAVSAQLAEGKLEVSYGFSEKTSQGSRQELDATFQRMNG
ncbi:MAG TPA: SDR family NAD(P)-dependent oxidoreductase [Spirochaetia bacterium]|nr:SDR family NAD(P)-dependent oxidoreductase [Spirochaetia bacterium]